MFNDLTILCCSYNTPMHIETMLKSFINMHGDGPFNIIIMENSTNSETSKLLDQNNIKYIKNPGGTHSKSIDELILNCQTKYGLLIDSDIVFLKPIDKLLEIMRSNDISLMGEICGNRGGYKLHPRVHPWFCLINIENIKNYKIKWHDQNRIDKTKSNYFYSSVPINPLKGNEIPFYDNGSTFYEDINNANLNIINAKGIRSYFNHYEGSSWHRQSGNEAFIKWGNNIYDRFLNYRKIYDNIIIKDKFKSENLNKKILVLQPIFCPDNIFFEINKKSILSLFNYLNEYKYRNIKVILGGYCKNKEYYDEIINLVSPYNSYTLPPVLFDKNYGKAYIINNLFNKYYENEDHLLTMDSDIIFDINEYDIIRRLIKLSKNIKNKYNNEIGMISLNQKDLCCHMWEAMDNNIKIDDEIISWSSKYYGIAGGCLWLNPKAFKKVGGYRVMGAYSGDDGYLLYDLQNNHFMNIISKTISIIHPKQTISYNHNYQEWKHKQLESCRKFNGKKPSSEEFEKIIDESQKHWNNKFKEI
jgi:hypothetical protein